MNAHRAVNATLFPATPLRILRSLLSLRQNRLVRLVGRVVGRMGATISAWRTLARSRRDLAQLDEYQLKDIGLTASQASFESSKFFLQR
jgi:uncharacterized protein YjiS (DUF1127 family)